MAIAVGAVARLIWVLEVHPPGDYIFSDMRGYVDRAMRLAAGADLVRYDAFSPPGTHMLLAFPFTLLGPGDAGLRGGAMLWWALSSATPLLAWRFALRLLDPKAAALTAILCAAYPLFVFYSGVFTSETPVLALLLAALWLGLRARQTSGTAAIIAAVGAGAIGAAVIATRPQFVLNLAIVCLPLVYRRRSAWRPAAAFALSAAAVLTLVIAHNTLAAGQLTGINENGGLVFYQGQCDVHLVAAGSLGRGDLVEFGNPVAFELDRGTDRFFPEHPGWDQGFFYSEGLECVRESGLGHISRLARNVIDAGATSTPFPLSIPPGLEAPARSVNLGFTVLIPIIVLGALVALVARRRTPSDGPHREGILLLHLACVLPVVVVFSSEPRYRIPYDVFALALLAHLGVAGVRLLRRGRATGSVPSS